MRRLLRVGQGVLPGDDGVRHFPDLRDGLEASLPIPSLEVRVPAHLPVFVEADKFGCSVVPLLREPHLVPAEQVGTHQGGVMGGEDQKKAPIWTNVQIGA